MGRSKICMPDKAQIHFPFCNVICNRSKIFVTLKNSMRCFALFIFHMGRDHGGQQIVVKA